MWMPPQTTVPPFLRRGQRRRHQRPDRREDQRRVELFGRLLVGAAGPGRAEPAREFLRRRVAGPREGEDLASLIARDLRHDVRRRAEPVDPERAHRHGTSRGLKSTASRNVR